MRFDNMYIGGNCLYKMLKTDVRHFEITYLNELYMHLALAIYHVIIDERMSTESTKLDG